MGIIFRYKILLLQKKKLRRAKHHERVLAAMKEKRKSQKMRRKQKLAEQKESHITEKGMNSKDLFILKMQNYFSIYTLYYHFI